MATVAYTSGITAKLGNAASPEVFTAIEECFAVSGLGVSGELIEVTHFGSGGSKEYIAGLKDGSEITLECNKVNTASSIQADVRAAIDAQSTRNFEIEMTDGTTVETYAFAGVCLGWENGPSVDDKNTVNFTIKISGAITIT